MRESVNEFTHHLHDTVILLGGRADIAELLLHLDKIDEPAVNVLRQYNIDLQTSVKDRLVNINTIKVRTTAAS